MNNINKVQLLRHIAASDLTAVEKRYLEGLVLADEYNKRRGDPVIVAEWIPHMNAYRLYRKDKPQSTVAYVDNLDEPRRRGYDVVIEGGEQNA